MKKLTRQGEVIEYSLDNISHKEIVKNWICTDPPTKDSNMECDCGSKTFGVCWWDYPYTGGYCKITCSECGEELVLIDDYS